MLWGYAVMSTVIIWENKTGVDVDLCLEGVVRLPEIQAKRFILKHKTKAMQKK